MPPLSFTQRQRVGRSLSILAIAASVLGVFALTNPDRRDYETYVTDVLSDYLIERVCVRFPDFSESCHQFIVEHEAELLKIVEEHTNRANFWLFSAYTTEIALPMLPAVEIRVIGVSARFFPYDVKFPDGTDAI
ncbi:MAG: DUF4359 domain-containing protein [Coleofasciculaceae cyanobacterium RL_1_1]|nr:DUF4359 domain-containing protein [Coleofasciculaceae cyanobacterium RL_1_1]